MLNNKIELDSLKTILGVIIHTKDTSYLRTQLDRIIRVTSKNKNSRNHVYALIVYGQLNTKKTIPYLNEAYRIAKKNNFADMLPHIINSKGSFYEAKEMYDSLLVMLIEQKKLYENNSSKRELVAILHSTADLYYSLKLYDQAENLYLKILKAKGDLSEWKFWRNEVIVNDLGLIEMKRGNYGKALKYFKKSFNIINTDSTSSRYTMALGYNFLQQSSCYLKMKKDSLASVYYNRSLKYLRNRNMKAELTSLYLINSELLFNKSRMDSSLFYTNKAFELYKENGNSKNMLLVIYKSFSKIFKKSGSYKEANNYLNLYVNLQDSLNVAAQSTKQLQTLAENNYQINRAKINLLETRNYFLIALFAFTFIFSVVILAFYMRLKNAYSKLVDKNLIIDGVDIAQNVIGKNGVNKTNNQQKSKIATPEQKILIENLDELMKKEKSFLKNDISIHDIALQLNSNRTYLSSAINTVLQKNFVAYINEFRIKEAIREISSGKYKEMTIEGISVEVGFNNRVSFNSAFKKYSGVLPSYFIDKVTTSKTF